MEGNHTEWLLSAACKGMDPNMFMPLSSFDHTQREIRDHNNAAKAVCATCPVTYECRLLVRNGAVKVNVPNIKGDAPRMEYSGVFAGETLYDRNKAVKRIRAQQAQASKGGQYVRAS